MNRCGWAGDGGADGEKSGPRSRSRRPSLLDSKLFDQFLDGLHAVRIAIDKPRFDVLPHGGAVDQVVPGGVLRQLVYKLVSLLLEGIRAGHAGYPKMVYGDCK